MQDWYFGTSSNQRPQAWQERTRNTVDPQLGALRIVPPITTGGPPDNMPVIPLLAVAEASDTSTMGFRSSNQYQQKYEPPTASSSPIEDSFASAILQASSRSAPDLLGCRRPTPPEPYRSASFPHEFRSGGIKRQEELGQQLTEGARQNRSRLSSGYVTPADTPDTDMPNSTFAVSNHGSRPPRFQRMPTLQTASPSQPRYVQPPPGFHYYPAQSQPSREQGRPYHQPSRQGPNVSGGIQSSSSTFGGSRDHVSTELCEAILAGAARLAQGSPLIGGSVFDLACMGPRARAPAQPLDTFTAMATGGPHHPIPCGRGYSRDNQLAEPSFQIPMYEASSFPAPTTAHQKAYEHAWLPAPSQVPALDRFPEQRTYGSGLVGWPHYSRHESGGDNVGVNRGSNVRQSVQRPCRVCGKVYAPH